MPNSISIFKELMNSPSHSYRTGAAGILFVALFLIVSSCGTDRNNSGAETILLAHAMGPTHPVTIAMEQMAERLEEYSGGELTLKIYPGGTLGGERKLLELMQIGAVDMTKVSGATLENIVPAIQVLSLPYLFRDRNHMINVLDGEVGRELLQQGEAYKLKGIAYYDAGSRSLYTVDKPVRTPEDLSGMKMRVMESVTAIKLMDTMGGSPTPISYGELYTAFQGGMVDGAENNPPSFYNSRHYEVCDYYIINEHATIPDILVISPEVWNGLDDQKKQWLQRAIDDSVEFQRELWQQSEKESMQAVQEAGVEIIYPDKEPFKRAIQPMYDHIQQNDPELHKWVERVRNVE
jgi:tripartite ATP-independent transporter DctP family solute receptor